MSNFNNLQEIKDFIVWCKSQGVKSFKDNNIQVEISDVAIISSLPTENLIKDSAEAEKMDREAERKEMEDLLFHSARR